MARIRTIKPEFPQSETVGKLSRDARLLFIQLWTVADDFGRARAASRMLASLLYPYDDDARALIDGWMDELEQKDCIRRYEADGSHYLEIINWLKHQKIDRPSKSRLPEFREGSRGFARPRRGTLDLGPRPKNSPSSANGLDDGFGQFWAAYPKKKGKPLARKAYAKAMRETSLPVILAALSKQKQLADWKKEKGRYIPEPASWLNAGRWDDEIEGARPGQIEGILY